MSTSESRSEVIISERIDEHLVVIRINRPERRNAFDGATARAMEAAIDAFEDDDSLRCGIITGSDIVFSAGQDLIAAAAAGHGCIGEARRVRHHGDAADEAGHRRDRRARTRGRARAGAVVRPDRGVAHREHGTTRGGPFTRRRRRRAVPAAEAHSVPLGDGAGAHGQAVARDADGRDRPRQSSCRSRSGAERRHRAGERGARRRATRGASEQADRAARVRVERRRGLAEADGVRRPCRCAPRTCRKASARSPRSAPQCGRAASPADFLAFGPLCGGHPPRK